MPKLRKKKDTDVGKLIEDAIGGLRRGKRREYLNVRPGSRAASRNRRPFEPGVQQSWIASDGSAHRTRRDALRAVGDGFARLERVRLV